MAAEQSLTKGIENMKSNPRKTATPSAAARSWRSTSPPVSRWPSQTTPTFDLQTLFQSQENYKAVSEADNQPLFNRALLGQYSPGSTFKPLHGPSPA